MKQNRNEIGSVITMKQYVYFSEEKENRDFNITFYNGTMDHFNSFKYELKRKKDVTKHTGI
jgi:hypothetical protein